MYSTVQAVEFLVLISLKFRIAASVDEYLWGSFVLKLAILCLARIHVPNLLQSWIFVLAIGVVQCVVSTSKFLGVNDCPTIAFAACPFSLVAQLLVV